MSAALTPREQRLLARRREPVRLIWAEPFHQAWSEGADLPGPLRLARATRAQWRESRPVIRDDELVLGRSGICPTLSAGWGLIVQFDGERCRELLAQSREGSEERSLLEDIVRTWEGQDFAAKVTGGWRQRGLDVPDSGAWPGPWPGHASQQYRLLLELGASGMRDRIARGRAANPGADAWYDSLLEIVAGVCEWGQAVRAAALSAGEREVTRQRRTELLELAEVLSRCPEQPARSFREAVQTFWLAFYLNGPDSCARLDRDLGPYLERDLAEGAISEEQAREIISSLWIRFEEHRTWSAVIGGVDEDGNDVCNAFTRMALEACERLGLEAPNLSLRVHEGTPDGLLRRACRAIAGGGGMPALVNDEPIIQSLQARGVSLQDARDYALTGCTQVVVPGRSHGIYEDSFVNALKWLELALHDGYDVVLQRQVGPGTGASEELATFEELMAAWQEQMRAMLDKALARAEINLRVLAQEYPSPLRSLLGYDTVETGVDVRAGGYRYNEGLVDVLGMTNLADSLAVIRGLVFEGGEFTLPELVAILDADWVGSEPLRERCVHQFPKFGNGLPEHDAFAASASAFTAAVTCGLERPSGLTRMVVCISTMSPARMGAFSASSAAACASLPITPAASAAAFQEIEKRYRRVMGYEQLWMLKAHLDASEEQEDVAPKRKTG